MGQLIGMLVKGDVTRPVRALEVRTLECSDHLKEVVYRCIGVLRANLDTVVSSVG